MAAIIRLLIGGFTLLAGWFASLSGAAIGQITVEGAKFLAWRSFILFILAVVIPVLSYNIITNVILWLFDVSMQISSDNTPSTVLNLSLSFTGFAGWIATNCYLPQAVSIYLSAISIRFFMHLIPFL